jgi:hypothetical protein
MIAYCPLYIIFRFPFVVSSFQFAVSSFQFQVSSCLSPVVLYGCYHGRCRCRCLPIAYCQLPIVWPLLLCGCYHKRCGCQCLPIAYGLLIVDQSLGPDVSIFSTFPFLKFRLNSRRILHYDFTNSGVWCRYSENGLQGY